MKTDKLCYQRCHLFVQAVMLGKKSFHGLPRSSLFMRHILATILAGPMFYLQLSAWHFSPGSLCVLLLLRLDSSRASR